MQHFLAFAQPANSPFYSSVDAFGCGSPRFIPHSYRPFSVISRGSLSPLEGRILLCVSIEQEVEVGVRKRLSRRFEPPFSHYPVFDGLVASPVREAPSTVYAGVGNGYLRPVGHYVDIARISSGAYRSSSDVLGHPVSRIPREPAKAATLLGMVQALVR